MGQGQREKTCCFTGHRQIPREKRRELEAELDQVIRMLVENGVRYFGAGGALGFDTMAAEAVLKLKKEYAWIRLILVLPCQDQTRGWTEEQVKTYQFIRERADKVVCLTQTYAPGCMQARNRHLINHSGICVAYCTRTQGGSAYTVNYAKAQNIPVIFLGEGAGNRKP